MAYIQKVALLIDNLPEHFTAGHKVPQRRDRWLHLEFYWIGEYCTLWSLTTFDATHAYFLEAYFVSETVYKTNTNTKFGFSVRCVKN